MLIFTNLFFPDLPNLGVKVRCAPKSVYRCPNEPKIPSAITVYTYVKDFMKGLLDSFSPIMDPLHFIFSSTLYSSYF